MSYALSILIPTLPSRLLVFLPRLLSIIQPQIEGKPVELLALLDNRSRSLGEKRNELLRLAQGHFLSFVDDDDRVSDDYVSLLLDAIDSAPDIDCIVYDSIVTVGGRRPKLCKYGIELEYTETRDLWCGKPSHTMCWRSQLAKECAFPAKTFGEDADWVALAWPKVKKQVRIDKAIYFYEFSRRTSETRERGGPLCSITIATHNKPLALLRTLASIRRQRVPFDYEVVVVDDGSEDADDVRQVCLRHGVEIFHRINRELSYRNPGPARNAGYRLAKGEVVISQSDEIVHETPDAIERLVCGLRLGEFHLATVHNSRFDEGGEPYGRRDVYTSAEDNRPLFFWGRCGGEISTELAGTTKNSFCQAMKMTFSQNAFFLALGSSVSTARMCWACISIIPGLLFGMRTPK